MGGQGTGPQPEHGAQPLRSGGQGGGQAGGQGGRGLLGQVIWLVREIMGDHAYEHWCAHHRRVHGTEPPLTRAEFWRQKVDAQEKHPSTRCC